MTSEQVTLVQDSFKLVLPIKTQAAALFCGRLFEIDPTTRPLFTNTDMTAQGGKLMAAIAMVVNNLANPAAILPVAKEMAQRHFGYGVARAQYDRISVALLWTLGQGLGAAFTPEVAAAWGAAYSLLAGVMVSDAYA
jgi:hemoglobin-like flavoprotein